MRVAVLALALAACAGPPPVRPPAQTALLADFAPAEFRAAADLLVGFDGRVEDADWRPGDRALFGLRLRKDGDVQRWLMLLTVLEGPLTLTVSSFSATVTAKSGEATDVTLWSRMAPVEIRVLDAGTGEELGNTRVELPSTFLGMGLVATARRHAALAAADATASSDGNPRLPTDDRTMTERDVAAFFTWVSLLQVVQEDDVLADYLWEVVEKPGVFSVLANFGVEATVSCELDESAPATDLPAHLPPQAPGMVVPIRIDVNGSPALFADVLALEPARPFALCGGIVAVQARPPPGSICSSTSPCWPRGWETAMNATILAVAEAPAAG